MITSFHNPKIKQLYAWLTYPKARRESGIIVLEGVRLIESAVQAGLTLDLVLYSDNLSERGKTLISKLVNAEVLEVDSQLLGRVSATTTSQGIIASTARFELNLPEELDLLLVMDNIQDPGNAGSLLRSALGAGAQAVIFTPGSVDPYSPKVLRAGMGAHFYIPIRTMPIEEIKYRYHDRLSFWTTQKISGTPYWQVDMKQPSLVAIGSEATGVSREMHALCPGAITIPTCDKVESLNAAVAGSIILFEARRQRAE